MEDVEGEKKNGRFSWGRGKEGIDGRWRGEGKWRGRDER